MLPLFPVEGSSWGSRLGSSCVFAISTVCCASCDFVSFDSVTRVGGSASVPPQLSKKFTDFGRVRYPWEILPKRSFRSVQLHCRLLFQR